MAAWYKRALRQSLLGKIYADKAKVKGVDQNPKNNEEIYHRYLQAYKKGVFNYIKEDVDKFTNETIPRKYFSGGAYGLPKEYRENGIPITHDPTIGDKAMGAGKEREDYVRTALEEIPVANLVTKQVKAGKDAAMTIDRQTLEKIHNFLGEVSTARHVNTVTLLTGLMNSGVPVISVEEGANEIGKNPLIVEAGSIHFDITPEELKALTKDNNKMPFTVTLRGGLTFLAVVTRGTAMDIAGDVLSYAVSRFKSSKEDRRKIIDSMPQFSREGDSDVDNKGLRKADRSGKVWRGEVAKRAQILDALGGALSAEVQSIVAGLAGYSGDEFKGEFTINGLVTAFRNRGIDIPDGSGIYGIHDRVLMDKGLYQKYRDVNLTDKDRNTIARINNITLNELVAFNRSLIDRGDPQRSPKNLDSLSVERLPEATAVEFSRRGQIVDKITVTDSVSKRPFTISTPLGESNVIWEDFLKKYPNLSPRELVKLTVAFGGWYVDDKNIKEIKSDVAMKVDSLPSKMKPTINPYVSYEILQQLIWLFKNERQLSKEEIELEAENLLGSQRTLEKRTLSPVSHTADGYWRRLIKDGFITDNGTILPKFYRHGSYSKMPFKTTPLKKRIYDILQQAPPLNPADIKMLIKQYGFLTKGLLPDMPWMSFSLKTMLEETAEKWEQKQRKEMEADEAMATKRDKAVIAYKPNVNSFGGIDFNSANLNLQIKRDGKGVPLPVSQQSLENIKINGLIPIIIDIKPMSASPLLSEFQVAGVQEQAKV